MLGKILILVSEGNVLDVLGNVSDVLLNFYHFKNQHNTRELPYYYPLYTIEISVFKTYNAL